MFGKHFKCMYSGSMLGAGADVFAVWGWIISHTWNGTVEINPALVAVQIGMSVNNVNTALAYLEKPDPDSRNPSNEGRRIVREGSFLYRVPSHETYLNIRDDNARKSYMRTYMRDYRAKKDASPKSVPVNTCKQSVNTCKQPLTLLAERETETETERETEQTTGRVSAPPTPAGVGLEKSLKTRAPSLRNSSASLEDFRIAWNAHRGQLPACRSLSDVRKRKLVAIINAGSTLEQFTEAVRLASRTPFCRGETERGWKLDFDFLIASDNSVTKVLEGSFGEPDAEVSCISKSDEEREAWYET